MGYKLICVYWTKIVKLLTTWWPAPLTAGNQPVFLCIRHIDSAKNTTPVAAMIANITAGVMLLPKASNDSPKLSLNPATMFAGAPSNTFSIGTRMNIWRNKDAA